MHLLQNFVQDDQLNIPQAIKNYGPGGVKADESIIDEKEFMDKLSETAKMLSQMLAQVLTQEFLHRKKWKSSLLQYIMIRI